MSDGIIVGCGGGAGLNFHVKAYASELTLPATEAPNTIAVLTEETISKWALRSRRVRHLVRRHGLGFYLRSFHCALVYVPRLHGYGVCSVRNPKTT